MNKKREKAASGNGSDEAKLNVSKDFKIALSAMMSDNDFEKFNNKFLGN
eukprot:CAMPEP_0194438770 /NCGR_PEP_ID=MMETSP0176-20130528/106778_1 /TAXON_ID=216777 /ORGANISM="Proboscia alata, Strain PI-D3" /LENGTH=48 /DNA_ID= /DNA_START= /DNA_END= /DNA_ORIENTATION=